MRLALSTMALLWNFTSCVLLSSSNLDNAWAINLDSGLFWSEAKDYNLKYPELSSPTRQTEDRPRKEDSPSSNDILIQKKKIPENLLDLMRLEPTFQVYLPSMMEILPSSLNEIVLGQTRASKFCLWLLCSLAPPFIPRAFKKYLCLPRQQLNARLNFSTASFPKTRTEGFAHVITAWCLGALAWTPARRLTFSFGAQARWKSSDKPHLFCECSLKETAQDRCLPAWPVDMYGPHASLFWSAIV